MSTFTLAISCLTTFNLPWFMDLTFQVPMQYCYLQHWTLLLSPIIPTTGCCFCFVFISSFFLELFLHWSPVAYWALPTWGVHLSKSYLFAFSRPFLGLDKEWEMEAESRGLEGGASLWAMGLRSRADIGLWQPWRDSTSLLLRLRFYHCISFLDQDQLSLLGNPPRPQHKQAWADAYLLPVNQLN